jgi:Leucine-rich repeat (LRR) protein
LEISAQDNDLTSLPTTFERLTTLKRLNLAHNNLTNLPEGIGNMVSLEKVRWRVIEVVSVEK